MTLIAAFRCAEGVVVCADSQETIDIPERGQYRVRVDKIDPQDAGNYEVVIGGSGDGPLVDGFVDGFVHAVSKWKPGLSAEGIKSRIRRLLRTYHENEVRWSAAFEEDKFLGFVVCIRAKAQRPGIFLWKTVGPTCRQIHDVTLLGWEEPIYWREASRLYEPNLSTSTGILLGAHLFSIAKETSNVISGDTKVVVIRESGIYQLKRDEIMELEQRVKMFSELSDAVLLALPDVTIAPVEFRELLNGFQNIAINLHNQFLQYINFLKAERLKALPHPLDINSPDVLRWVEDPYTQIPSPESLRFQTIQDLASVPELVKDLPSYDKLLRSLHEATVILNAAAKLNRNLYESGEYGPSGSDESIQKRKSIAAGIHKANEELIKMLEIADSK